MKQKIREYIEELKADNVNNKTKLELIKSPIAYAFTKAVLLTQEDVIIKLNGIISDEKKENPV